MIYTHSLEYDNLTKDYVTIITEMMMKLHVDY